MFSALSEGLPRRPVRGRRWQSTQSGAWPGVRAASSSSRSVVFAIAAMSTADGSARASPAVTACAARDVVIVTAPKVAWTTGIGSARAVSAGARGSAWGITLLRRRPGLPGSPPLSWRLPRMRRSHSALHLVGGRPCTASPVDTRCASPIPSAFPTPAARRPARLRGEGRA